MEGAAATGGICVWLVLDILSSSAFLVLSSSTCRCKLESRFSIVCCLFRQSNQSTIAVDAGEGRVDPPLQIIEVQRGI